MLSEKDLARFRDNIMPEPNSGCWLWTGGVNSDGYARLNVGGKKLAVHRISYVLHKGNITEGLQIDHLCKVRCCVNPQHLEAVTPKVNTRRSNAGAHFKSNTHCRRGHPYDDKNTYRRAQDGCRGCWTCYDERNQRRKAAYHARSKGVSNVR